ncbi:hypothetical protein LSAT2_015874, partial [Lamellibrachia satsuma]
DRWAAVDTCPPSKHWTGGLPWIPAHPLNTGQVGCRGYLARPPNTGQVGCRGYR